jgi:hypothetical protein
VPLTLLVLGRRKRQEANAEVFQALMQEVITFPVIPGDDGNVIIAPRRRGGVHIHGVTLPGGRDDDRQ